MANKKQAKLNSIRETIELIAKDQLNPRLLAREDRRLCVEFLRYELRYPIRRVAQLLKTTEVTVKHDLKVINVGIAHELEAGEVGAQLVGQLMAQLQTNYDLALDKRDVASANKATELLQKLAQDLGHVSKAEDTINHRGLDILGLALSAGDKT